MMIAVVLSAVLHAQPAAPPVDDMPAVAELPDPFLFQDGERVSTPEDWRKRREEMLALILRYQYGHMPPPPGNVRVAEELESGVRVEGSIDFRRVKLSMGPEEKLSFEAHIYLPAKLPGPFPVVLRFGLGDPNFKRVIERGYAFACFQHKDLDPDTEGHDVVGPAQAAYPDYDWASLAVWAWGASRLLDYVVTLPEINAEQAIITGHSRTGKTALLAGAVDERFALVVPNGSGCGGAGAYRDTMKGAETLKFITLESRFKSWFHRDFGLFSKKEARLPFDQHFMRALVAPRVVLSTDGLGDKWANPPGTQAAWMAAQPVFDFLGEPENNLCHFREGGHDQLPEDFDVLLDVADWHFRGKPLERSFATLPDSGLESTWKWKAP